MIPLRSSIGPFKALLPARIDHLPNWHSAAFQRGLDLPHIADRTLCRASRVALVFDRPSSNAHRQPCIVQLLRLADFDLIAIIQPSSKTLRGFQSYLGMCHHGNLQRFRVLCRLFLVGGVAVVTLNNDPPSAAPPDVYRFV